QGDGLVACTQCNAEGASCSVGAGSLSLYTGSRDRSSSEGVASTVTGNCQGCTAESGTSLAQGYVAAINVNISLNNTIQVCICGNLCVDFIDEKLCAAIGSRIKSNGYRPSQATAINGQLIVGAGCDDQCAWSSVTHQGRSGACDRRCRVVVIQGGRCSRASDSRRRAAGSDVANGQAGRRCSCSQAGSGGITAGGCTHGGGAEAA